MTNFNKGGPEPRNWNRSGYSGKTKPGKGAGMLAERMIRIDRMVQHMMLSPRPMIEGMEKSIGCSRATLWRELRSEEFKAALRSAIDSRFVAMVCTAADTLEALMADPETPHAVRMKTAMWVQDRFDALNRWLDDGDRSTDEDPVEKMIEEIRGDQPAAPEPVDPAKPITDYLSEDGVGTV